MTSNLSCYSDIKETFFVLLGNLPLIPTFVVSHGTCPPSPSAKISFCIYLSQLPIIRNLLLPNPFSGFYNAKVIFMKFTRFSEHNQQNYSGGM